MHYKTYYHLKQKKTMDIFFSNMNVRNVKSRFISISEWHSQNHHILVDFSRNCALKNVIDSMIFVI